VYPALAVLQRLDAIDPDAEVLWVGGRGGMEEDLVRRAGVRFQAIPAAGVHGVGWRRLPKNVWRLVQGYRAARDVVQAFQPHALFFTGGYVAVPVALAARGRPVLLYVPDIEPGLALKVLTPLARTVAVTVEASRQFFSARKRVVVTGYPLRQEITAWIGQKARAREHLVLPEDEPVVLVFGGSRGARSINRALLQHLPSLLERTHILHISGTLDWPQVQAQREDLPAALQSRYHVFPYLHGEAMGAALAAADFVVSRAGASTLGEFPAFGLPAILVPYPYAWRYQQRNAAYLAERGAARILPDAALPERLASEVFALLDDAEQRAQMAAAMRRLYRPNAAERIAELLWQQAGGRDG